jgi:hypothetical protein
MKGMEDVRHFIWTRKAGEQITFRILRKHKQLIGTFQLEQTPAS